jgi:hypothetical protein
MGETGRIEYRFTVSPTDLAPFFAADEARIVRNAGRNIALTVGAALFFYILSNAVQRLEGFFALLGGLTLVTAISMFISFLFRKREKPRAFEPFEAVVVASPDGIARFTNSSRVMYEWNVVNKIYADDFGLHIDIAGSGFLIPRSAFSSRDVLSQEGDRLQSFKAMVEAGDIAILQNEAVPSTLH